MSTAVDIPQTHSFRLTPRNPREERALAILMSRRLSGYTVREIVVEALLKFDEEGGGVAEGRLAEMHRLLEETFHRVDTLARRPAAAPQAATAAHPAGRKPVSGDFLTMIRQGANTGRGMA